MCGLFGYAMPTGRFPMFGSRIYALGVMAQERGTDAAGVAWLDGSGWRRRRSATQFVARVGPKIKGARAQIMLGHTRSATQGMKTHAQASPGKTGPLFWTHNGDVAISSIPFRGVTNAAATDSAALFSAIASAYRGDTTVDLCRVETVLAQTRGRIAAVWVDTRTDQVWLARGGLSPLSVGVDTDGGLWWASNPAWLTKSRARFSRLWSLPEGTLFRATPTFTGVDVDQLRTFVPTVRSRDLILARHVAYRGFAPDALAEHLRSQRHRVSWAG